MNKKLKVALVTGISALLVVAIFVGTFWFLGRGGDPVKVAPVTMFTGWIGGETSQGGFVTADRLQKVYASETQTITEILVMEGQQVVVGMPLLRYDTTLTDIQIERQSLTVQQLDLDIEWANKQLKQINAMKPYTPPPVTQPTTAPTTQAPTPLPEEELPYFDGGKGTEKEPYYYLCAPDMIFDEAYLSTFLPELEDETDPTESTDPTEESTEPTEESTDPTQESTEPTEESTDPTEDGTEPTEEEPDPAPEGVRNEKPKPGEDTDEDGVVWVVFEVREKNALNGELIHCMGLTLSRNEETGKLQFKVFEPPAEPEPAPQPTPKPWVDTSSGYTSSEIAAMRNEKQREIRDLNLQKRMAELELKRMRTELENGYVYATVDGIVMSLLDPETAAMTGEAVMTVSAGGSYYVETAIGEFDLEAYPVGSTVEIMLYATNERIEGTVQAISETPNADGMNYSPGNPNTSFYSMTVAIDANAPVLEGDYVDVYFSDGEESENALCIENRFIRTDESGSYVFLRGENGKLRKQYVLTGAVQWGYTVIKKGLTEEDWIAFPYGKDVKSGADTVESEKWEDFNYFGTT